MVALAASEPKEECPAYTPRSVYDECQKRFNEGEKECDRAPDLIAAHKCTDRWLDWLIDVCPGELTKKLCKLVCGKDQELKGKSCEPKAPPKPPDDCPKGAATGSGFLLATAAPCPPPTPPDTDHEKAENKKCQANPACKSLLGVTRPLTKEEQARLQGSFGYLDGTKEGGKSLYGVVPRGKSVPTLGDLEKAGVMVRASSGKLNCGKTEAAFACTSLVVDKKGKKTFVIRLDEGLLKAESGASAPWLGHELRHVADRKRFGDNVSVVKIEQAAYLRGIYIAEQLKKQGKLCSDMTDVCQNIRLQVRIWEDDLKNRPMKAGEFTPGFSAGFEDAKRDEANGLRATKAVLERLRQQHQGEDRKEVNPLKKRDREYLSNGKELDKAIAQDDAFRIEEKLTLPVVKK